VNDKLQKAVASLGHRLGAAKRRKHGYLPMPIDLAQEIHNFLASKVRAEYIKEYRKL
jgi:hypothetical protein